MPVHHIYSQDHDPSVLTSKLEQIEKKERVSAITPVSDGWVVATETKRVQRETRVTKPKETRG